LGEYVQQMGKTYRAGLLLGARSDTDDADGTVTPTVVKGIPDRQTVEAALALFVGWIDQVPPAFSAAKVVGRRAYELARRGEKVALKPHRVHVDRIDILTYDFPHLELEVHCGKGTYIRSLARDLGERLGCGGLVQSLRRTHVGPFEAAEGLFLDADASTARAKLLPPSAAVRHLPQVVLGPGEIVRLRQGQPVPLTAARSAPKTGSEKEAAVFDVMGMLVAVVGVDYARQMLRPEKVFSK
jgi:tRNA pseudouridine55 synthase